MGDQKASGWAEKLNAANVILGMLLGFCGFLITKSFDTGQYASNLANKADMKAAYEDGKKYTDSSIDALKKYTDTLAESIRQDAYNHSDKNKSEMQQMILMQGSDLKAQGVKMDMVLDTVRELRTATRRGK